MLTEVISKLDRAVLELAIEDAISEMCFYEGEELTANLESYLEDVKNETNTEEQDQSFFELSMPYIEKSIMVYGRGLYESGTDDVVVKADEDKIKQEAGFIGAQALNQSTKPRRKFALNTKGLDAPGEDKKITESEEEIWDDVFSSVLFESVKKGIEKAKKKILDFGENLGNATKAGIASAKNAFESKLSPEVPSGDIALASPGDKK